MEINKWTGLRNTVAPERLRPGELASALDVDVDDRFAVQSRRGQTAVNAVASHSMWAKNGLCLVAQGQDLKRLDFAGGLTQLKRLQSAAPLAYAELNGVVYFTNGTDTGRVVQGAVKEWGIRRPAGQPKAFATAGDMPPGRYLYTAAFVRTDGLESGTIAPELIELASTGGIQFTHLPASSDPDVRGLAIYLSGPNGEKLYHHRTVSTAVSEVFVRALAPQWEWTSGNAEPAPAGTSLAVLAGTIYVADGPVVWYSDQYSLERFRRGTSFMQLPGPITMLMAVERGLFAATDSGTWFFAGTDPKRMQAKQVLSHGAIPGTAVPHDLVQEVEEGEDPKPSELAALWASPNGVIIGGPDGSVRNLTEGDYSFPSGQRGAGLVRVERGYASYIASIQGTGAAPNEH